MLGGDGTKGRAVHESLSAKAERLLIVANTLNNPADRAIASHFVEDLKAIAACEICPPAIQAGFGPTKVRASVLGTSLQKAFPVNRERMFYDLIGAL